MDVKLALVLGLFLVVTVKSDVRHPDALKTPKTCEGATSAHGGSLDQMVGSVITFRVTQSSTLKLNLFLL